MVTGAFPVHMGTPVTSEVFQSFFHAFKRVVVDKFSEHGEKGLFSLKIHLLDQMEQYINRFGSLHFLDAIPFKYLNINIKQSYKTTSLGHGTRTAQKVRNIGPIMKRGRMAAETARSIGLSSFENRTLLLSTSGNHLFGSYFSYFTNHGAPV